uniref:Cilia- and flagella-associated protein 53 n=1 Tax=Anabas testudineus TaxID=64144 RepID=A0A7N6F6Y9_ANATE
QSSERHFLRGTIQRQVQTAVRQYESKIQERRNRLRVLLEETKETTVERQARMREKAKVLRLRREGARQPGVRQAGAQCEELRTTESRRREQQVSVERAAQVRSRQELQLLRQQEEKLFDELWDSDRRAKEERERQREQRQEQRNKEQLDVLKSQVEAAKLRRQKEKELREEDAHLLVCVSHTFIIKSAETSGSGTRRRQLDQGLRLKMKRLAQEQQEELQLDMSILQQLLAQESDEKHPAVFLQLELREEQQRYRQYLSEELQKQRREEEETKQLIEEKLKETWTNRLINEVMEARRLQIQHKRKKKREDRNFTSEFSLYQGRGAQSSEAYQADLRAQVKHQQQLRREERAQAEREHR